MSFVRNRARVLAAVALASHVIAMALVSAALSCDPNFGSDHASVPECPLHTDAPACPLHAEKHGSHDCDCPTIGCSETNAGFMALFGAAGILGDAREMPAPLDAGAASVVAARFVHPLVLPPLAPPPRS